MEGFFLFLGVTPEPHKKYRHPSHEEYRYFLFIPLFAGSKTSTSKFSWSEEVRWESGC